jgi:hypothetical protein
MQVVCHVRECQFDCGLCSVAVPAEVPVAVVAWRDNRWCGLAVPQW